VLLLLQRALSGRAAPSPLMAHRVAREAEAELDDIWYYIAKEGGSIKITGRVIDSITDRFFVLARRP